MLRYYVVSLWLQILLLLSPLSAKTNNVCVSPGGRFRPFSNEGNAPKKVRELTLCRMFRAKTCCDVSQTHSAFLSTRRLASAGEANQECIQLWELLECSICDPHVGTQTGPPLICASFCERVFHACSDAYFSMDAKTQVLAPCGVSDFVCGRTSEWVSNGTELCLAAGFSVKLSEDSLMDNEERSCYGGKASLDSIADPWKGSQNGKSKEDIDFGSIESFRQWFREMPPSERISWAVGGLVLTAGLFFISKRKSHNQRQKQVAILRNARKLEAQKNQRLLNRQNSYKMK
ncbi:Folate-binding protein 1-like protein [Drosera capensis]